MLLFFSSHKCLWGQTNNVSVKITFHSNDSQIAQDNFHTVVFLFRQQQRNSKPSAGSYSRHQLLSLVNLGFLFAGHQS